MFFLFNLFILSLGIFVVPIELLLNLFGLSTGIYDEPLLATLGEIFQGHWEQLLGFFS